MNNIKINNNNYVGRNISVVNGKVIIDGKDVTPDAKEVIIMVTGDLESLKVDVCNTLTISGNVTGNVQTASSDVDIRGAVGGNVNTMSGDVDCGEINGSVSTMSGDIKIRKSI